MSLTPSPQRAAEPGPAAEPAPARPLLDLPDPPTARTQALHDSMRAHETTARGTCKLLTLVVGATVACALVFVLILVLRLT